MSDLNIFQKRRAQLANKLPMNSIALIPAAKELLRNGDAHYRFRQDSDFYYLTGFEEPDALLVLFAGASAETVLFNRAHNPEQEQWTGRRLGQDGACEVLNIDRAYAIDCLDQELPALLCDSDVIYFPVGRYPEWDKRVLALWNKTKGFVRDGKNSPEAFFDVAEIIAEMRVIKSACEIKCMQYAADASIAAHKRAMRACKNTRYEYELEAELTYALSLRGCRGHAYDPIVAGGENACILHYIENNQKLNKGDLVLIDAGAEYQNYASDITRTFPVNGTFSAEQKAIYSLVLAAQEAAFACIRPGACWNDMQQTTVRVLTAGLVDLGLLHGDVDELIAIQAYKPFYMHRVGHWLGLDVHDSGRYMHDNVWRKLEADMVFTVEPGLYISKNMPGVDERWWGIGVRIEDDVRVTKNGYDVFSDALPTAIDEVEALVRDE